MDPLGRNGICRHSPLVILSDNIYCVHSPFIQSSFFSTSMKKFIIILFALVFALAPAQAETSECPKPKTHKVQVQRAPKVPKASRTSKSNRGHRHKADRVPKYTPAEQAARLSTAMNLSDAVSAKFVPLYISCCSEIEAVFSKYPITFPSEGESLTDAQLKKNNDNRFHIARAIMDIREKYYKKYNKILTASQIDLLYRKEKHFRPQPPMP